MYDVVIVGSGPAGISASLYTKRANLSTLVVSKGMGTLEKVKKIENYYGFAQPISGEKLFLDGKTQAKRLGVEFAEEEVVKIDWNSTFIVEGVNHMWEAKVVILATGASRNIPKMKGVKELEGKGVSYCATCDAFFYKGKDVGVLGNGDYALHEASVLAPIANSVTMFTNGEKLVENREIEVDVEERNIREVRGIEKIEEVRFEDDAKRKIDGLFIALGTASSSDLARKIGAKINEKNEIVVNQNMETTVPGLLACGDCTGGILQISKAVYEGTRAGLTAIDKIRKK
mgnify:CR=1 FL=1